MHSKNHIIMKLLEGQKVSTLKGVAVLDSLGKVKSMVSQGGEVFEVLTRSLMPMGQPLTKLLLFEGDDLGKILTNGAHKMFSKRQSKDTLTFTSKTSGDPFFFTMSLHDGSINSPFVMANVLEAYAYLIDKGYDVTCAHKNPSRWQAQWT